MHLMNIKWAFAVNSILDHSSSASNLEYPDHAARFPAKSYTNCHRSADMYFYYFYLYSSFS
ncbi:hypothetical protein GDI1615 [Gluconacetobacter diazotrophicus PA1 5]|uniref:Uncharacterized protein n=1 Tax=Gluconacetobacter diazotrophicus (strain ATCC 49037 / DSM 5601 / CCUG 37298 / CIP 103539 / LMG 7603 / PAl5) TaxID=272568 RepID=A9HGW7_GLUDA|nr:hypothetical protein GDI1615 [Gluconacetobacter diazotrophicus PA1 5]